MRDRLLFKNQHAQRAEFTIKPNEDLIEREPMLFGASWGYAEEHGGPLTRDFLAQMAKVFSYDSNWIIDTRVTMLRKGWLPCIGGWHLDHCRRYSGQPDLRDAETLENMAGILDVGTGSLTEYLVGDVVLEEPQRNHYATCDTELRQRRLTTRVYPSGAIVSFNGWHRGQPAVGDGWRFWIRASRTPWHRSATNKIRRQVNVYLPDANAGW